MATINRAAASETLGNIDAKLREISGALGNMSAADKAKFDNSDVASGMADVFKGVGGVLTQNQGVVSAANARTLVQNGERTVNPSSSSGDAMAKLMESNRKLQQSFEQEKATRERLEADMSISDQKTEQAIAEAAAVAGAQNPDGTSTAPTAPADGQTTPEADAVGTLAEDTTDPVAQALAAAFQEQQALINERLDALDAFVEAEDEDLKRSVQNIRNLSQSQIARAQKENDRLARAARVAGIVAGRGQYSPEEHEGIISEVIQDGLARVEEIEFKTQEAELAAKKAHREFRYKSFVEASNMVEALAELKRETIVDIADRLRQVEQDQREKQRFDAEMADRNAFILAPELMNATPEEIARAAAANGIEVGALSREIQAYKQEQEAFELDKRVKEENILSSQQSRNLAWQKYIDDKNASDDKEIELKGMDKASAERFTASYGWNPPFGLSEEEAMDIERTYAGEPSEVKERRAKERLLQQNQDRVSTTSEDIAALVGSDEELADAEKALKKSLGIGRKDSLYENEQFQQYVAQFVGSVGEGETVPTRQVFEAVIEAVNTDNFVDATLEKTMSSAVNAGVNAGFRKEDVKRAMNQIPIYDDSGELRDPADIIADTVRILREQQKAMDLPDGRTANSTPAIRR